MSGNSATAMTRPVSEWLSSMSPARARAPRATIIAGTSSKNLFILLSPCSLLLLVPGHRTAFLHTSKQYIAVLVALDRFACVVLLCALRLSLHVYRASSGQVARQLPSKSSVQRRRAIL